MATELIRSQAAEQLVTFAKDAGPLHHRLGLACRMGANALREVDRLESRDQQLSRHVIQLDSTGTLLAEENDRLTARIAELEQEVDELKELLDDVPEHIIQVRATTFTLKHPLSCRPNLFDCPFNEAGRDLPGPPAPLGCYVVTLDEAGGLLIGEAVDG